MIAPESARRAPFVVPAKVVTSGSARSGRMLLVLAVVLGCSEDPRSALADEDGLAVRSAGDIHEVGTAEVIGRIADLAAGPDGMLWILNATEPYFIAMRPDGSVERSWGRRGGGPNEFRNPNALVADAATGAIWAYDRGHHALLRVDGPEDQIETVPVPRASIPVGRIASAEDLALGGRARAWIRATEAGFLVAVSRDASSPFTRLWNTDIVLLTRAGTTRPAFPMSSVLGDPAGRFGAGVTEFLPYPLWANCPDGALALYDPLSNSVRLLAGAESPEDSVVLPPERRLEITADRIFRMAFRYMRDQAPAGQKPDSAAVYTNLQAQWNDMQSRSSAVFPEYADLQCTAARTLWLQRFDPDTGEMGRGTEWLRIRDDGVMESVRFPDTFRPLRFEAGRVLGVHRGDLDIESVAWVRLDGASR